MCVQKEVMMHVNSVIAAGLCFLAVAAPHPSAAQSPTARAVKQVPRFIYVIGEGWKIDPPLGLYGKYAGVEWKGKLPGKWPITFAAGMGSGLGLWWCTHTPWCLEPKH